MGNTCSGFVAAGNRTYRGIETDIHVTADGQYIIIHDDNTINTTGDDYVVEEIRALGWLENTVFISFSHDNMVELRRLLPDAKLMFLPRPQPGAGGYAPLPEAGSGHRPDGADPKRKLPFRLGEGAFAYVCRCGQWKINQPTPKEKRQVSVPNRNSLKVCRFITSDAQRMAPQQSTPTTMPQIPRKYPEYTRGPDTLQA